MEEQIEEILKKKGIKPGPLSQEEFMEKMAQRLEKVMPVVIERISGSIIAEELASLGRSEACRYWHKTKGCLKGIKECYVNCEAYQPIRWWQQKPGIKAAYAMEALIIGFCVFVGVLYFFAPKLIFPIVCIWLLTVIASRIQIIVQRKTLRMLTGL